MNNERQVIVMQFIWMVILILLVKNNGNALDSLTDMHAYCIMHIISKLTILRVGMLVMLHAERMWKMVMIL